MIPQEDYKTFEAMRHFGGATDKALAKLLKECDIKEYKNLKKLFKDRFKYWQKTAEGIEKRQKEKAFNIEYKGK